MAIHPVHKKYLVGICLMLVLTFLSLIIPHFVFLTLKYNAENLRNAMVLSRLMLWLVLLVTYIYAVKVERNSFLLTTDKRQGIDFYLASIIILFLLSFVIGMITGLIFKLLGFHKSDHLAPIMEVFSNNKLLFFSSMLTAGIVEELLFRGYIFSRLQLVFKNTFWAVAVSSVLFGLIHFGYGTLQNVIGPVLLGVLYALYYNKYKTIVPVIIAHGLYDYVVISLSIYVYHLPHK